MTRRAQCRLDLNRTSMARLDNGGMSRVPNHVDGAPGVGEPTGRLAEAVLTLVDDAIYVYHAIRLALVTLVAVSVVVASAVRGVGTTWTLGLLAIGIAVVSVLVF